MKLQSRLLFTAWIAFIWESTWISLVTSEDVCLSPLGMEDGRIEDSQLKGTGSLNSSSAPKYARFNHSDGYGGWCPSWTSSVNETGPVYKKSILVNFNAPVRIRGIILQGRAGGKEKAELYRIYYERNPNSWEYVRHENRSIKGFKGNKDNEVQQSILVPPIIAYGIRLVPALYPNKQVCMRFELLGCSLKNGLVAYTMPQGNSRGGRYNFTDSIYDGLTKDNLLSFGLGFLSDGQLAPADYVDSRGLGWIGWHAKDTPDPYVVFEFLGTRIFRSVTIHCNVGDQTRIKLFAEVKVSFSLDGTSFDTLQTHGPKDVTSGSSWINHNVTIDLCQHIGKYVKFNFTYAGEWILISEVAFRSDPLGSDPSPEVKCTPTATPPLYTVPPLHTTSLVTTSSPPEDSQDGFGDGSSTDSDSMNGGVIAGIIIAALAVLVAIVLFVCWWRYPHWFFQREKPFDYFIKVEMQPYNQSDSSRRVSRLDSTASESEERRNSMKKNAQNGRGGVEAEVTACPIYASVGEKLDKEAAVNDYVNGNHKFRRLGSDVKPLKKVKPVVPPPLKPVQAVPEVVYAQPDTPLLTASTPSPGPSPKPTIPPRNSKMDFKQDFPDNDYAEPDTPINKSPTIVSSPTKPKVIYGYADPVDAISPTLENTFHNPIYEEVYSEPYQGVSGTSLYCNPADDLNMRTRQDSFKDFPRQKLYFREKIGDGQFGEVYIGEAEGLDKILGEEFRNTKHLTVAIKMLKPDVDKNIKNEFFKEVKAMASLRHTNVIRLLGVCRDDPMCMIVEYMANGDLNQFLKDRELEPSSSVGQHRGGYIRGQLISLHTLFYMAKQVAAGMKYISSLNYVHRDLATRNCLVGHAYMVKIADFGMSRNLYSKHYYRIEGRAILPIRWMAPESILQGRFTTASDVWAYGVTLWEILTLAREYPYSDLTDEEVISMIQRVFHRADLTFTVLPKPDTCPGDLYELMSSCWRKEPEERPSFTELHDNLAESVRLSEASV